MVWSHIHVYVSEMLEDFNLAVPCGIIVRIHTQKNLVDFYLAVGS